MHLYRSLLLCLLGISTKILKRIINRLQRQSLKQIPVITMGHDSSNISSCFSLHISCTSPNSILISCCKSANILVFLPSVKAHMVLYISTRCSFERLLKFVIFCNRKAVCSYKNKDNKNKIILDLSFLFIIFIYNRVTLLNFHIQSQIFCFICQHKVLYHQIDCLACDFAT